MVPAGQGLSWRFNTAKGLLLAVWAVGLSVMSTPAEVISTPPPHHPLTVLCDREQAEGYVVMVCFKHGPPRLYGVELGWTVHHDSDPNRALDANRLCRALGPYAPPSINPCCSQRQLPLDPWLPSSPVGRSRSRRPRPDLRATSSPWGVLTQQRCRVCLSNGGSCSVVTVLARTAHRTVCCRSRGTKPCRPRSTTSARRAYG